MEKETKPLTDEEIRRLEAKSITDIRKEEESIINIHDAELVADKRIEDKLVRDIVEEEKANRLVETMEKTERERGVEPEIIEDGLSDEKEIEKRRSGRM